MKCASCLEDLHCNNGTLYHPINAGRGGCDGWDGRDLAMDVNGLMGGMDVICVVSFALCDERVICVFFLETSRVPHPWSARKPHPSLLQVLVGMQKLLLVVRKVGH